jgi:HEAT repeat protein
MTEECWFFAKPGKIIKKTPDIRAARSALGAPGSVNEVLPMRQSRFLPRIFRLGLGLAAVAALSWWAAHVAAQTSSHDPVEQLRRDLRDGLQENEVEHHDRQLTSVGDLRRALDLTEWKSGRIDVAFRRKLGERFKAGLKAALSSTDATVRLAAAILVAEIETSSTATGDQGPAAIARTLVPEIAKLTRDADTRVRTAAARALGKMNAGPTETWTYADKKATVKVVPSAAVVALKPLLSSENVAERRAAAEALVGLVREAGQYTRGTTSGPRTETTQLELIATGTEIVPVAARALDDADPLVRRLAVEAIHQSVSDVGLLLSLPPKIGDALPVKLFLPSEFRSLPEDDQEQIKKDIRALATKTHDEALDTLIKTLGRSGDAVLRHLRDPDAEVRLLVRRGLEEVARVRASAGKRRPTPVKSAAGVRGRGTLPVAHPRSDNPAIARVALEADDAPHAPIGATLEKAVQLLATGPKLADPDLRARLASIDLLERLGEAAAPALPALLERLDKDKEPNRFVRWAAARALAKTLSQKERRADQRKAAPVLAGLLTDSDPDVRLAAAVTLESYGPGASQAVGALTNAAKAGDPDLRKAAINVLVSIGPASRPALPVLIAALDDPEHSIRQAAAEGLGKLGRADDKAVIDALRKALDDENGDVRRAAGEALVNVLRQVKT